MEYYRLQTLNEDFNLPFDKIRYYVEQKQLDISFFCARQKFIYGHWKTKGFVGKGILDYEGILTLNFEDAMKLFRDGSIIVHDAELRQVEKASQISTTYPFKEKPPNTFLYRWRKVELEDITPVTLPVRFIPTELNLPDTKANLGNNTELINLSNKLGSLIRFQSKGLYLCVDDICIYKDDLVRLMEKAKLSQDGAIPQSSAEELQEENSIDPHHKVFLNAMRANRQLGAASLWKVLCEDFKSDRIYDPDEILEDIQHPDDFPYIPKDELYLSWAVGGMEPKKMKRKAFRTFVGGKGKEILSSLSFF